MKYLPIFFIFCIFLVHPFSVHAQGYASQSASLNLTARVPANPRYFQFDFTNNKRNVTVGADEEIEYTITYGSDLSYSTPMTIEAEWSLGLNPTDSLYSYNVVSYVAGSATKDYWGESTPIVDTLHRKIIWQTPRFPRLTKNKTLRFKLKTVGRYITDKNINFTVTAKMRTDEVTMPPITLDQTYAPGEFIKREVKGMQIVALEVRSITDSSFTLFLGTSIPTKAILYYGTTPELGKTYVDDTLSDQKLITIDGLYPATTYYYQILIENDKGIQRKTPEIFQVTTSSTSLVSLLEADKVMVASRGVIIKNIPFLGIGSSLIVPSGIPLELYLPFRTTIPYTVYLTLSNKRVLGLSTDSPLDTSQQKIRLLETQSQTFTGSIMTPMTPGIYDLTLETESQDGDINRDVVATLVVSKPITILSANNAPVEHALIYLEKYNSQKQAFEYYPAETYGGSNPSFTDQNGEISLVLPQGDYTINVNAIGFKTYQKVFSFNPSGSLPYPTITLVTSPFSLVSYIQYYLTIFCDSVRFFDFAVANLAVSGRFLNFSLLVSIVILTILSTLVNLKRLEMTLEGFLIYIEKMVRRIFLHENTLLLYIGCVNDSESDLPVHGAIVSIQNGKTRGLVGRDVTNALGHFHIRLRMGESYDVQIKKPGYETVKVKLTSEVLLEPVIPVTLPKIIKMNSWWGFEFPVVISKLLFTGFSDTFLFTVGILHILFFWRLGIKVLPMTLITVINGCLWLEYHWAKWREMKAKRQY